MVSEEKIHRIIRISGNITILKRLWNVLIIVVGLIVFFYVEKYTNELSIVTLFVPIITAVLYYQLLHQLDRCP
ncbi:MAG: hypothetical protein N4A50_07950 [Vallitalea sp.]|jgi:hypothetical protein|nr:hypothetical protein [Vallitalea sp.]